MAPTKLVVSKKYTDEQMLKKYQNTYVKPSQIDTIIRCDTDVYTDTGELLLRFRKKKLSKKHTDAYYDATAEFTVCLLYTSPSPRDQRGSRMPSSA